MFISHSIKTEIVTITPKIASILLEQNTNNRPLSMSNLLKTKAKLENGEWKLNGEAIKVAADGMILDGQHRLIACSETGIPFDTLIVYGLESESQTTMDTGRSRTVGNILSFKGYKNTNRLAATVTSIIRYENWSLKEAVSTGNDRLSVTEQQVLKRLQSEPRIVDIEAETRPIKALGVGARTGGMLRYVFENIDRVDSDYFFEKLESGEGLNHGDPILTLRNVLIVMKNDTQAGRRSQAYIAAIMVKAWNKFRIGETVKQLRFRIGGANPETFPEPI